MRYEVIKDFKDKFTKVIYRKGGIYDITDAERAEYLQEKGFLGKQVDKKPDKQADSPEGPEDAIQTEKAIGPENNKPESESMFEELKDKIENGEVTMGYDLSQGVSVTYVGGGWYELPDGRRVRGKEAAEKMLGNNNGDKADSNDNINKDNGGENQ